MTGPSPFPEVPLPFPLPPGRAPFPPQQPVVVPTVDLGVDVAGDTLAAQRRLMVSGALDGQAVNALAAQLMTFDGVSGRDVELIVSSVGGPLSDILPILDVLRLMRAPVNVTAIGSVSGTAVGLVAAGTGERRAAPHARFTLRVDTEQSISGTADEIARRADDLSRRRADYLSALAAATGQDADVLAAECESGRVRTADEALALGLIDAIADRP
ncbi:MAG: ATP-dependent Clp protease proteolytic subunit [Actinomycetota bacterium]